MTDKCNLACNYCYEKNNVDRTADREVMDIGTIIAFIKEKADQYKERDILISFHGGEPLLEYNKIREYVERLEMVFRDRRLFLFMTTNGLLLNREKADYLMSHFTELSRLGQRCGQVAGHQAAHGGRRHHRAGYDPDPPAVHLVLRAGAYGYSHRLDHGLAQRAAD